MLCRVILLSGMIGFNTLAFSGGNSGGGGVGVVCRGPDQKIATVELLDLWEARTLFGLTPELKGKPYLDLVQIGIERAKNIYEDRYRIAYWTEQDLEENLKHFTEANPYTHWLRNVKLKRTEDSFELAVPDNCELEQIVNYKDSAPNQEIYINQDLFDKLDDVNKSALLLHEIFYKELRDFSSEENSIRTRRAIGQIVADKVLPPATSYMYQTARDKRLFCYSADFSSVIYLVIAPQVFERGTDQEFTTDAVKLVPARLAGVWIMGIEKLGDGPYFGDENLSFDKVRAQLRRPDAVLAGNLNVFSHIDYDTVGSYKLTLKDNKINILLKMDHFTNGRPGPVEEVVACDE
jgi:hypothetical protein